MNKVDCIYTKLLINGHLSLDTALPELKIILSYVVASSSTVRSKN